MADSSLAIKKTLIHEGGYVDNPADSGHATNMGITQADMPGVDIKNITELQAVKYYEQNYWKPHYGEINSQPVADKLFDMGVLFGVGSAVNVLQAVLGIPSDGAFGPVTLEKLNSVEPVSLLMAYKTGLVSHAVEVVKHYPKNKVFFAGWVNRINS